MTYRIQDTHLINQNTRNLETDFLEIKNPKFYLKKNVNWGHTYDLYVTCDNSIEKEFIKDLGQHVFHKYTPEELYDATHTNEYKEWLAMRGEHLEE